MKKLCYKLRYFLATSVIFASIALLLIIFTNKLELHLYLNRQHTAFTDIFFKYYTNVGDGAFALLLLPFCFIFSKIKHLFLAFSSCLIGGMLAQILKRIVFFDALRPKHFFADNVLHIVDGVSLHSTHSFPSGHTASAFAFFIFLAFIGKKSAPWQYLCAFLAILVGYSRVYLSHHFLVDVVAGALVGIIGFYIAYLIHKKLKKYHFEQKIINWLRALRTKSGKALSYQE